MNEFKKDMQISITEYLQSKCNSSIKNIMSVIDMTEMSAFSRKKIRQKVLDELNEFLSASYKVLIFIQEED